MIVCHKDLASGRWAALSFAEKMANIGSEVDRALNWRQKNNPEYARQAFERALELMDFTLDSLGEFPKLKEVARIREVFADYFVGDNQFGLTDECLKKYFLYFTFIARKDR